MNQAPANEPLPAVEQVLGKELLQQTLNVQSQATGLVGNFLSIVKDKSHQMLLSILGDYGYKQKNEYNYTQKQKILSYLQSKVFTLNSQLEDEQKVKFTDFDPHLLQNLPKSIDSLRNKILKAKTNLDCAKQSLQKIKLAKGHLTIKYLNEQAYEFDKTRYNSIGWGLVAGAFVNITIYRHGNPIRKAALFLTIGHLFGIASYASNLNRYFDSVYPIFEKDAVKFSLEEKQIYKDWKPQGKAIIED